MTDTSVALFIHQLELRERLAAIVRELNQLDPDLVDVPATIAEGLLEDLDLLLDAA